MRSPVLTSERLSDWRWWAVLLRSLIALAFGVIAFARPGVTLATLALLFGCNALAGRISLLLAAIPAEAGIMAGR